jgi:hypothetical protein
VRFLKFAASRKHLLAGNYRLLGQHCVLPQVSSARGVSSTLAADSFGPDGLLRVPIIQFVAMGAIATSSRGCFLDEAIRHESVTMLRCVLFGRIVLRKTPFQQKAIHGD